MYLSRAKKAVLRTLIEEYAQAISYENWQQDQGHGAAVGRAVAAAAEAKAALEDYLKEL